MRKKKKYLTGREELLDLIYELRSFKIEDLLAQYKKNEDQISTLL